MIWLHNARIIAIFAVVFLHAASIVVTSRPVGSEDWWMGNLYDSLVRWCVPVFVMISGALLLDPDKEEDLTAFYGKRLSRVLIPILVWSMFYLFWTSLKGWRKGAPLQIVDILKMVASGKPHYHMWFLYMITILYVFTPFFRRIVSNSSRREMAVLVSLTMLGAALNSFASMFGISESKLFINWFLRYIPYFLFGYLIRSALVKHQNFVFVISFIVSVTLTALGCYFIASSKNLDAGLYFYDYLSITVIPMSISIMFLLKRWTTPIGSTALTEHLSSLTLGIYLIHPIFLEMVGYVSGNARLIKPAISVPLTSAVVFFLSLASAWTISKIPYVNRTI